MNRIPLTDEDVIVVRDDFDFFRYAKKVNILEGDEGEQLKKQILDDYEIVQKVRKYKKDMDKLIVLKITDEDLKIGQAAANDVSNRLKEILGEKWYIRLL